MAVKQADLDILLHEGEGSMLEYKEALSSSFARDVVGFANSAGGKILLGVRDDGTVVGVQDTNGLRAQIQDIARNCDPPVRVLVEPVGKVLVVTVRESENKPVQCREGFFWRQGAGTQTLSRDEIRDFFRTEGAILQKYGRAKAYCYEPFEVSSFGNRKTLIPVPGEWIGEYCNKMSPKKRGVDLRCQSATAADLSPSSLDAVLTDPPYFGNVQYAELMDFCYVWLRRLVGADHAVFQQASTRHHDELTENTSMGRGVAHFTEGLSAVFQRMARALKPGAPLAFTYHHNQIEAYYPLAVAILDASLTCSASLPCPAEMGGSIHINGTGSSVVDTVFVCRSTGSIPR